MQREERAAVCCFTFFIFQSPVKSAPISWAALWAPAGLPGLEPCSLLLPPPSPPGAAGAAGTHPTCRVGLAWGRGALPTACRGWGGRSFLPASCLSSVSGFQNTPRTSLPQAQPGGWWRLHFTGELAQALGGLGTCRRPGEASRPSPQWQGTGLAPPVGGWRGSDHQSGSPC